MTKTTERVELNEGTKLLDRLTPSQYNRLLKLREETAVRACENCNDYKPRPDLPRTDNERWGTCYGATPQPVPVRSNVSGGILDQKFTWPLTRATDYCRGFQCRPFDWEAEARRLLENG